MRLFVLFSDAVDAGKKILAVGLLNGAFMFTADLLR